MNTTKGKHGYIHKSQTRNINRENKRKALIRRENIIMKYNSRWYCPHVGFYTDEKIHFKYPNHSKSQQFLKRQTSKLMRRVPLDELHGKSNIHHKYREYWWELY